MHEPRFIYNYSVSFDAKWVINYVCMHLSVGIGTIDPEEQSLHAFRHRESWIQIVLLNIKFNNGNISKLLEKVLMRTTQHIPIKCWTNVKLPFYNTQKCFIIHLKLTKTPKQTHLDSKISTHQDFWVKDT